jgi:DNA repair exonuclease SbcCD ATPase subunit
MEAQLASNLEDMIDLRSLNIDLEDQLRSKEMQIILLNDDIKRLDNSLEAKTAIVERLTEEQQELLENLRIIQLQMAEKDEEIEAAQLRLAEISAENAEQLSSLNRQVAELLSQLDEKEAVLLTLSSEKSDLEMVLARQRQDFSSLEDKYLKLIRPARSAMSKQVVTVQYSRVGNLYKILFKDIGVTEGQEIDLVDLHRRLAALKERYGYDLYVKIVIPDDSGLSYNEAWDFTKDILSRYDYYYVDGWPGQEKQE